MDFEASDSPTGLDTLPDLVFRAICSQLGMRDCQHLALASKACLHVARATIFATITISAELHSPNNMVAHISQLTERLKRLHCLIHVRTLRLFGDPRWDEYGFDEYGDHLRGKWERPPYSGDDEDCRLDPPDNIGPGVRLLSQLISLLPGLKDCVYAWDLPIPHDLFQALETRRCRLHFELFQLPDLLRLPSERDKVIGPLDMRLATSPLLHTVRVNAYDEYHSGGYFNFHLEGLLDMVKGLAPGLRQVSLLRREPENYSTGGNTRWEWQGTELGTLPSGLASQGSLTCLELAGNGSTALKEMRAWHEATDFSKLKELKLHEGVDPATLAWMVDCCDFSSLRHLVLHLQRSDARCQAMLNLFANIGLLTQLKLVACIDQSLLSAILKRHGPTLRDLVVIPDETSDIDDAFAAKLIADHCPMLERLTMPICRRQGSVEEIAVYQAFSRLTRLEELYLVVEFVRAGSHAADLNTEIKNALINHAIDPYLAVSIFGTIGNGMTEIASSTRFRRLEIRPSHSRRLSNGPCQCIHGIYTNVDNAIADTAVVCEFMAGHWICQRSKWANSPNEIFFERGEHQSCNHDCHQGLSGPLRTAFYELWPKQEGRHWTQTWHSFPLAI